MSLSYHFLIFVSLGVVAVVTGNNYKPPAYHQPKYEPKYEPEIPACSKNTTKNWCLEDSEYPAYEVVYELDKHYEAVVALYKNVVAETANSVDTLTKLVDETYLCPSATSYVQPLRAVNTKGKWRVIINKVESYGIKYDQHARIEECEADAAGKACPLVPTCYESKCLQKSIYHRFLVYDPTDYYFPFAIETFKLPASCACFVGAFSL